MSLITSRHFSLSTSALDAKGTFTPFSSSSSKISKRLKIFIPSPLFFELVIDVFDYCIRYEILYTTSQSCNLLYHTGTQKGILVMGHHEHGLHLRMKLAIE